MTNSLLAGFLIALLILVSPVQCQNPDSNQTSSEEPVQKKRSHKWLIAVGAGAGFGLGLLIGFNAFDESINSDAKIWTTTAICAAAGGFLGWLFAHHMDQPEHKQTLIQPIPAQNLGPNFICTDRGSYLMQQARCMYPDYLGIGTDISLKL
jgi:uncharacterized membrane protein YfcA